MNQTRVKSLGEEQKKNCGRAIDLIFERYQTPYKEIERIMIECLEEGGKFWKGKFKLPTDALEPYSQNDPTPLWVNMVEEFPKRNKDGSFPESRQKDQARKMQTLRERQKQIEKQMDAARDEAWKNDPRNKSKK